MFNPRTNEDDIKVYAAVATSWDTYYPHAERGENLHNIAIEGMKDVRIIRNNQQKVIDSSKMATTGLIDIALPDNRGNIRKLSDLKGKVCLLYTSCLKTASRIIGNLRATEMEGSFGNKKQN